MTKGFSWLYRSIRSNASTFKCPLRVNHFTGCFHTASTRSGHEHADLLRSSPKRDLQRLIGADGNIRRHAKAFQAPILDREVVGDWHPQMKAAGNVEQVRRQNDAWRLFAR
jgi:hypothetical protein